MLCDTVGYTTLLANQRHARNQCHDMLVCAGSHEAASRRDAVCCVLLHSIAGAKEGLEIQVRRPALDASAWCVGWCHTFVPMVMSCFVLHFT